MRAPVEDSSTHRAPAKIGLTVAALTGAAVLGVIGARALTHSNSNVGRRFRHILDVLTNQRSADAGDDAAYESTASEQ